MTKVKHVKMGEEQTKCDMNLSNIVQKAFIFKKSFKIWFYELSFYYDFLKKCSTMPST